MGLAFEHQQQPLPLQPNPQPLQLHHNYDYNYNYNYNYDYNYNYNYNYSSTSHSPTTHLYQNHRRLVGGICWTGGATHPPPICIKITGAWWVESAAAGGAAHPPGACDPPQNCGGYMSLVGL